VGLTDTGEPGLYEGCPTSGEPLQPSLPTLCEASCGSAKSDVVGSSVAAPDLSDAAGLSVPLLFAEWLAFFCFVQTRLEARLLKVPGVLITVMREPPYRSSAGPHSPFVACWIAGLARQERHCPLDCNLLFLAI